MIIRQYFDRKDFPRIINQSSPGFAFSYFKLNHLKGIFLLCFRFLKITERLFPQENIVISSAK